MARQVKIFDTTLRDGEQSPGCSMNMQEKLELAAALSGMGVDVIEAGFAASSPGDFEAVKAVSAHVKNSSVASLCRCLEKDIDAAWEALRGAASPRIHVFLATSEIHMRAKLRMTPEQVLEQAVRAVRYAKKLCADVQFSAEDAIRSDKDFLRRVAEAVIAAGATTFNIPDTVGYSTPYEVRELVGWMVQNCAGAGDVTFAVHMHNDLGMATANTISGIAAGAGQAEVTLCGIGERAGNAPLEEVLMTLNTRRDALDVFCRADTTQIYRAARMLQAIIGRPIPPNKPIVGANAFAHEAGIHQHGVMADRKTYEIMSPQSIGVPEKAMVLGKHSGRHAFGEHVQSMGYSLSLGDLDEAFAQFKRLADKKKNVSDRDIEAILKHSGQAREGLFSLESFVINSGNTIDGTAILKLRRGDEVRQAVAMGDGPVDASFKAVSEIVGMSFSLENYSLNSVTDGGDALGEALVRLSRDGVTYTGRGLSTDIIEASIKAYLNAANKAVHRE